MCPSKCPQHMCKYTCTRAYRSFLLLCTNRCTYHLVSIMQSWAILERMMGLTLKAAASSCVCVCVCVYVCMCVSACTRTCQWAYKLQIWTDYQVCGWKATWTYARSWWLLVKLTRIAVTSTTLSSSPPSTKAGGACAGGAGRGTYKKVQHFGTQLWGCGVSYDNENE